VTAVPGGSCCPALSPDGTRIAFVAGVNISVVGIDGTGLHELEPAFAASSTPSWSPDGSQIAFVGSRDGGQDDIYVMDADGSNVRRLTNDLADDDWPAWSPDGGTIAYANSGSRPLDASGFSPTDEIYTVPATGGRPTRLTDNRVDDTMPSYSPDGSQIAIHRSGGLWIMNADGSNAREIPLPGVCCTGFTPRWSPDGTKIAFTRCCASWRYNGLPVLAVNIVDLNDRVLPVPGAEMVTDANVPQWLPSGDELLLYRVERPRS
jgi:Tol biopolymer transport system component